MKKFLCFSQIIIFLFLTEFLQAQNYTMGVRGGISIPNLTAGSSRSNPLNTGYSSRQGPDAAIFGEYHVSSLFSIGAMVEYSSQGGRKMDFKR